MTESKLQLLDELLVDWEILAEQGKNVDLWALCESRGAASLHSELRRRAQALQDLARRFGRESNSPFELDLPCASRHGGSSDAGPLSDKNASPRGDDDSEEMPIADPNSSSFQLENGSQANAIFNDPQASAITTRDENADDPGYAKTCNIPPEVPGYRILSEVGRGGMGVVYLAEQHAPRRTVALKTLSAGVDAKPDDLIRFLAEAETLAKARHPNIIQIYEIKSWNGLTYICMEYASEGDLARRLAKAPADPRQSARLVAILAAAVHAMHLKNILHRDLKPSNVLFVGESPRIADFGLAGAINENLGHHDPDLFLGTPSYIAPEQALGRTDQMGPACDVYGLGTILYET